MLLIKYSLYIQSQLYTFGGNFESILRKIIFLLISCYLFNNAGLTREYYSPILLVKVQILLIEVIEDYIIEDYLQLIIVTHSK